MRIVAPLVGVAVVAACAVAARPAHSQGTRIVDQTYVCGVTAKAGVRKVEVAAQRGFRDEGVWKWFARASVENWGGPQVRLPPNDVGFVATSDLNWGFGGSAALTEAQSDPPYRRSFRASVSLTPRRACAASSVRVPLSSRGLDGGPADYFGDEYACVSPARVVVRVRATFAQPATLTLDRSQGVLRTRRAQGAVREAQVAVRTTSGRPLAYASASSSGTSRIFTAKGCTPQ